MSHLPFAAEYGTECNNYPHGQIPDRLMDWTIIDEINSRTIDALGHVEVMERADRVIDYFSVPAYTMPNDPYKYAWLKSAQMARKVALDKFIILAKQRATA